MFDWRTVAPATIQSDDLPVEELRYFQTHLDELLELGAGRYVLIMGQQRVGFFESLEAAVDQLGADFGNKPVLIKKVAALEPIHSLGGATLGLVIEGGVEPNICRSTG